MLRGIRVCSRGGGYGSCLAASAAIVIVLSGFAGSAWAQPGAPTMVALERIDPDDSDNPSDIDRYTSLKLTWVAPSGTITRYEFQYKRAGNNPWQSGGGIDSPGTHGYIQGLTEGVFYHARVRAIGSGGEGTWGETSGAVAPGGEQPGAPTNLVATPGDGLIMATWDAPSGSTAGIRYCLIVGDVNGGCNNLISETTGTVTGLTNGTEYTVQVRSQRRQDVSDFIYEHNVKPRTVPDAPAAPTVTAGDASLGVSWSAPGEDGGSAVTGYGVQYAVSGSTQWMTHSHTGTGTSTSITGLTNGTAYAVQVRATNAAGDSEWSASGQGTPRAALSEPRDLTLTPGDAAIDVSWTEPENGGPFTGYEVQRANAGDSNWGNSEETTGTSLTLKDLTNGTRYAVRVRAKNSSGNGPWSDTGYATPVARPSAPRNLMVTPGDMELALSWQAPADTGGEPITGYTVEHRVGRSGSWTDSGHSGTGTTFTIDSLTNGTEYGVRVSATNSEGTGDPTDAMYATPVAPEEPEPEPEEPGAPQNLAVTPGNMQLELRWDPPADNGGATITNYKIQHAVRGSADWMDSGDSGTTTTFTVTGLVNGTEYGVRVRAQNSAGLGPNTPTEYATPVAPEEPEPEEPGAPQNLAVTPGNMQLELRWDPPADNGGATITNYKIQHAVRGSADWMDSGDSGTTTTFTVTGLVNGTEYGVRVRAQNSAGLGPNTPTEYATPVAPEEPEPEPEEPGAPQNLAVTPGNMQLELRWDPPADNGGATITNYKIQHAVRGSADWMDSGDSGTTTTFTVTGLVNGTEYGVRVRAQNSAGLGPNTPTEYATPVAPEEPEPEPEEPGAPQNLAVTPGNMQLELRWDPPADNGGATITNYKIQHAVRGSADWMDSGDSGTTTTFTVTGLVNGTEYGVRVRAQNSAGLGPNTPSEYATPAEPPEEPDPDPEVPGVPRNLSAEAGNAQLTVEWQAPAEDGGAQITGYELEYAVRGSGNWMDAQHSGTETRFILRNLVNGTEYGVRVSATNSVGTGDATPPVYATPAEPPEEPDPDPEVPGVPRNLSAEAGNAQLTVEWQAPAEDGGAQITGYELEYAVRGSGNWMDAQHSGTETRFVLRDLVNGTEYGVRVSATNSVGTGDATPPVYATPVAPPDPDPDPDPDPEVPGVPRNLSAEAGNAQVSVQWQAPADNGGSPITGYKVEHRVRGSGNWNDSGHSGTGTSSTITGLTNGTEYGFRVAAVNQVGTGPSSDPVYATPMDPDAPEPERPGVPENVEVSPGDGVLAVMWNAPAHNGGAPVLGYQVEYAVSGSGDWMDAGHEGTATRLTITGLVNGTQYGVRVRARNRVGYGKPSDPVFGTPMGHTPEPEVPGVPREVVATPGDMEVTLSWKSPVSNGGAVITGYSVRYAVADSDSWTDAGHSGTGMSLTISGLTNGTEYMFAVSATNSVGTGPWSAAVHATPMAVAVAPGMPRSVMVTAGDMELAVEWQAPASDGGSPITGYRLEYSRRGAGAWVAAAHDGVGTSFVISGLTNGTEYSVRVSASNAVGAGSFSEPVHATPVAVPGAPTNLMVTSGDGQLGLVWDAPAEDGGAAITGYWIEYSVRGSDEWRGLASSGSDTSYTLTGLANGTAYSVRISAMNSVGSGEPSAVAYGTPMMPTPAVPLVGLFFLLAALAGGGMRKLRRAGRGV